MWMDVVYDGQREVGGMVNEHLGGRMYGQIFNSDNDDDNNDGGDDDDDSRMICFIGSSS